MRWAQDHAAGQFALLVSAPRGTKGTISVPVPKSGAVVIVRSSKFGKSRQSQRSFSTQRGAATFPYRATGGITYRFDVVPQGKSNSRAPRLELTRSRGRGSRE